MIILLIISLGRLTKMWNACALKGRNSSNYAISILTVIKCSNTKHMHVESTLEKWNYEWWTKKITSDRSHLLIIKSLKYPHFLNLSHNRMASHTASQQLVRNLRLLQTKSKRMSIITTTISTIPGSWWVRQLLSSERIPLPYLRHECTRACFTRKAVRWTMTIQKSLISSN